MATAVLFSIFYTQRDKLQRRNDINRITNLKTAMELEDSDFIKMVDEMKIDYDEQDLKEIERDVSSQLNRTGAGKLGIWIEDSLLSSEAESYSQLTMNYTLIHSKN